MKIKVWYDFGFLSQKMENMKTVKLLLLFFLIYLPNQKLYNQNVQCRGPIPGQMFQARLNELSITISEQNKWQKAMRILSEYCLYSMQVRSIAFMFVDEELKLRFCQAAYFNTLDKENYFTVLDAFAYFSSAFRLYDFMVRQQDFNPVYNNTPVITFPALPYPNLNQYGGTAGCRAPINENQFMEYVYQIQSQPDLSQKLALAINITKSNCMSTAQIMKISTLFDDESFRLSYLQAVWPNVFDRDNFYHAMYVFNSESLKSSFIQFLHSQGGGQPLNNSNGNQVGNNQATQTPCPPTINELNDLLRSIKNENFNNTRLNLAKNAIKSRGCFTALQIKEIVKAFDFESARLDLAKFAYRYCHDPQNYYLVADALQYSSSKDELLKFIENK